jgi:cytochrome c oxidase subunit I
MRAVATPISHAEPTEGQGLVWDTLFRGGLLTTDHRRIAGLYLGFVSVFLLLGLAAAAVLRLALLTPAGGTVGPSAFGALFTFHGMAMFYFVLLPVFPGVLGNALLPRMVGAHGMAFPRLNIAAWHLLAAGGTLVLIAMLFGGTGAGWSFDAPYGDASGHTRTFVAAAGVFLAAVSYALLGLNIVTTVVRMRAREVTWDKVPLFVWGQFAGALLAVVTAPVLAMAMALLVVERAFGFGLFDPAAGGDPLLFRRLFWIAGSAALQVAALPALGTLAEVVRRRVGAEASSRNLAAAALGTIAVSSLFLSGQHFLASGGGFGGWVSSALGGLMGVGYGVVIVHMLQTLARGRLSRSASALFALGSILLLVAGVFTGFAVSAMAMNVFLHNTTFVTAHAHLMTSGALLMALLAGLFEFWTEIAARAPREAAGRVAAVLLPVGVLATFLPLFIMGSQGALRRQYHYEAGFQVLQILSSAGATILLLAIAVAAAGLLASRRPAPSP